MQIIRKAFAALRPSNLFAAFALAFLMLGNGICHADEFTAEAMADSSVAAVKGAASPLGKIMLAMLSLALLLFVGYKIKSAASGKRVSA